MTNRRTRRSTALLALTALIAGGIVVAPTAASAQTGAPDQYQPPAGTGDNDDSGNKGDDNVATGIGTGTAEADSGDLPFTGYPLTWLVTLVLLLLTTGFLIRFARSRKGGNPALGPPA